MKTLYFIRHAESEANLGRIMASQLPYPLTQAGRADADQISRELKELVPLDRIISSPLVRAVETAQFFEKAYGLEPELDDRIIEHHLGLFSGMTYDEVNKHPSYEANALNRWNWIPEGHGESYSMVADRIRDFLASLENFPENENILIVTHAVCFRLIRALLEGTLPVYPKGFPNNGEIWKVEFQGLEKKNLIESIFLGKSRDFIHKP